MNSIIRTLATTHYTHPKGRSTSETLVTADDLGEIFSEARDKLEQYSENTIFAKPQVIFRNTRARAIAKNLTTPSGQFHSNLTEILNEIIDQFIASPSTSPNHDQDVQKMLEKIRDDQSFRDLLLSAKLPQEHLDLPIKNNIKNTIRQTIHLDLTEEITKEHLVQALLVALLDDLRQYDFGSCFCTSIAINIRKNEPETMIEDLLQIFQTGTFTRGETTYQLSSSTMYESLQAKYKDLGGFFFKQVPIDALAASVHPEIKNAESDVVNPYLEAINYLKSIHSYNDANIYSFTFEDILKVQTIFEVRDQYFEEWAEEQEEKISANNFIERLKKHTLQLIHEEKNKSTKDAEEEIFNAAITLHPENALGNFDKIKKLHEEKNRLKYIERDHNRRKEIQNIIDKFDHIYGIEPTCCGTHYFFYEYQKILKKHKDKAIARTSNALLQEWSFSIGNTSRRSNANNFFAANLLEESYKPTHKDAIILPSLPDIINDSFSTRQLQEEFLKSIKEVLNERTQIRHIGNKFILAYQIDIEDPYRFDEFEIHEALTYLMPQILIAAKNKILEQPNQIPQTVREELEDERNIQHIADFLASDNAYIRWVAAYSEGQHYKINAQEALDIETCLKYFNKNIRGGYTKEVLTAYQSSTINTDKIEKTEGKAVDTMVAEIIASIAKYYLENDLNLETRPYISCNVKGHALNIITEDKVLIDIIRSTQDYITRAGELGRSKEHVANHAERLLSIQLLEKRKIIAFADTNWSYLGGEQYRLAIRAEWNNTIGLVYTNEKKEHFNKKPNTSEMFNSYYELFYPESSPTWIPSTTAVEPIQKSTGVIAILKNLLSIRNLIYSTMLIALLPFLYRLLVVLYIVLITIYYITKDMLYPTA